MVLTSLENITVLVIPNVQYLVVLIWLFTTQCDFLLQIHLSFYLDRDSSYKQDKNDESPSNPVFGAVFNTLTQFAVLIGRTKDAELQ